MKHMRNLSAQRPCLSQTSLSVILNGILAIIDILVTSRLGKAWGIPRP